MSKRVKRVLIAYHCCFLVSDAYMYMNARMSAVTDRSSIAELAKSNSAGMDIL